MCGGNSAGKGVSMMQRADRTEQMRKERYVEKKVRSVVELISIEYLFLWSGFLYVLG